jgi:Protein of unknown function (DUF3999)
MSMKKIIVLAVASIMGITAVTSAAFTPSGWQYMRPINMSGNSGLTKVTIPEDISWTTSDFSDVRVIDGQGKEAPYLLSRNISSSGNVSSARLVNMTQGQDGSTRFVADFGVSGVVHTAIQIQSNTPNFRRQVTVYASDSLLPINDKNWQQVTSQGFIFKFTDPYAGSVSGKNTVTFPANSARYLKAVIASDTGQGSVEVQSVAAYRDVQVSSVSYSRTLSGSVYNNPTKKTSELTLDLSASGLISSLVAIDSPDTNYIRRAIVEVSDTALTSSWRYVGESSISKVSTSIFRGVSNLIQYPEQRSRFIRISIINDDNPALSVSPQATVSGPVLSAIFEARPEATYMLYYGNSFARKPEYDIAHLSSYIDESSLPVVSVGQQSISPLYVAPQGHVVPFTESHKILLNILLVILVLSIGAGVIMYLRTYLKTHSSHIG